MSQGSNTRSDSMVTIRFAAPQPGDCIGDKQAREFERRILATLPAEGTVGDSVVSRTPPEDKTKVWYLANTNGIPTGEQFTYNVANNRWESTNQTIPTIPCLSENTENIITKDSNGCWILTAVSIREIAEGVTLTVSTDINNAIVLGSDGGIFVDNKFFCISEIPGQVNFLKRTEAGCLRVWMSGDAGNAIYAGTDGQMMSNLPKILAAPIVMKTGPEVAGSVNVSTFASIPAWATHAIVAQPNNQTFVPISSSFITHGALLEDETLSLCGFIKATL